MKHPSPFLPTHKERLFGNNKDICMTIQEVQQTPAACCMEVTRRSASPLWSSVGQEQLEHITCTSTRTLLRLL